MRLRQIFVGRRSCRPSRWHSFRNQFKDRDEPVGAPGTRRTHGLARRRSGRSNRGHRAAIHERSLVSRLPSRSRQSRGGWREYCAPTRDCGRGPLQSQRCRSCRRHRSSRRGLTRCAPLFAPVEVISSSVKPSNCPPTLPPLRRNSSMLLSLNSRSERIVSSTISPSLHWAEPEIGSVQVKRGAEITPT